MSNSHFSHIVGQDNVKRTLEFYIQGYEHRNYIHNILFEGPAGSGKTEIAKAFAKAIGKSWYEVNGATIKNVDSLFDNVLLNIMDKEYLVFIDEFHAIPDSVSDILLSILNPSKDHKNTVLYNGDEYVFDFTKLSFVFATTEKQKIFKPLLSRMRSISLSTYKDEELATIIRKSVPSVNMSTTVAIKIASYIRGSARDAILLSSDIDFYAASRNNIMTEKDVVQMMDTIGIYPLGLNEQELGILKVLKTTGTRGISLNALSARIGHTKEATQELELYLQKKGLMFIEGTRKITHKGSRYLDDIDFLELQLKIYREEDNGN